MGSGKEYPVDWWRDRVLLTEAKKMEPVQKTDVRNPRGFAGAGQGRRVGVASAEREEIDVAAARRRAPCGQPSSAITRFRSSGRADPDRGAKCKIQGCMGLFVNYMRAICKYSELAAVCRYRDPILGLLRCERGRRRSAGSDAAPASSGRLSLPSPSSQPPQLAPRTPFCLRLSSSSSVTRLQL